MQACISQINSHIESIQELIHLISQHPKLNRLFKKLYFLSKPRLRIKFIIFLLKIKTLFQKKMKILKIKLLVKKEAISNV